MTTRLDALKAEMEEALGYPLDPEVRYSVAGPLDVADYKDSTKRVKIGELPDGRSIFKKEQKSNGQ